MRTDRLRKLIEFIRELPDEKFDFNTFVKEHDDSCGTVCCAAGWLPAADPENWCYRVDFGNWYPNLMLYDGGVLQGMLAAYFQCGPEDVERIFYWDSNSGWWRHAVLPWNATRSEWITHAESILGEWEDKIQDCEETHEQ